MNVLPTLWSRPTTNGLYQIKIRLYEKRGKVKYINTDIEIEKNKWDNKRKRVKELKSFPIHKTYNRKIDEIISTLLNDNPNFIEEIKKEEEIVIFSTSQFLVFFEKEIKMLEKEKKFNSYRKYNVVLNHLTKFYNSKFHLLQINRNFLDEFRMYLFSHVGLKQNGYYSYFKVFRTFINKLVSEGDPAFPPEYNPFIYYKISEDPVSKTKLTVEQFTKIVEYNVNPYSSLGIAKNLFVFSFYSGGMRIADLLTLQWRNIVDDRLEYRMRKTKKDISIPLNPKQIEILKLYIPEYNYSIKKPIKKLSSAFELYNWNRNLRFEDMELVDGNSKVNDLSGESIFSLSKGIELERLKKLKLENPHEFIFPPMKNVNYKDPILLNKKILSNTARVNNLLKKISLNLELGVNISTHVARHTMSDLMRKSGIGLYAISKILGHSDLAVTQKYISPLDREAVDKSMEEFYGK